MASQEKPANTSLGIAMDTISQARARQQYPAAEIIGTDGPVAVLVECFPAKRVVLCGNNRAAAEYTARQECGHATCWLGNHKVILLKSQVPRVAVEMGYRDRYDRD